MDAIDYILDGLEAALELERELGVRSVECERSLLSSVVPPPPTSAAPAVPPPRPPAAPAVPRPAMSTAPHPGGAPAAASGLVFLHHRPLPPKGAEMMEKIVRAMGLSSGAAQVLVEPPVPTAKVVVVLGARALEKFYPGIKGEPGDWVKRPGGGEALVTYSPEYILRFAEVTPAVDRIKRAMWQSLKAARQRLAARAAEDERA